MGDGVYGGKWGAHPTCMHMYVHTCIHTYVKKLQMANNMFIMINMCVCVCACVQMYHISTHQHPPPKPRPDDPQITKNAINLEQIKIIQFYFKICEL